MKPGRTANIRISPKDCMACIDLVKKTGMNLQGASFSVIVSAALSSALESFRQNGILPVRDGFEYGDMMAEYPLQAKENRVRALAITRTFNAVAGQVPAAAPGDARRKARFDELAFKSNHDPANMSAEEEEELRQLALDLNPL